MPPTSASPTILGPTTAPVGYHRFHDDPGFDFQCNRWLQWIGGHARREIADAVAPVRGHDAWVDAFLGLAERVRGEGRAVDAAYYDRAAEFFMRRDDPRARPARDRFVRELRRAYGMADRLAAVPFGAGTLPAYDLGGPRSGAPAGREPAGAARGAIVLFAGFDSYVEEFFPLVRALAEAGHRVIVFEGPGQGAPLEDDGLRLAPEWELPLGAVLDHYGLDDVTLIGVSLGGGLAIRAAAFDSRVRRVVADDVLDDFLDCVGRQVGRGAGPPLRLLLALRARPVLAVLAALARRRRPLADWGLRQGMHVTGARTPYAFLRAARALTTRRVSHLVTADVLLLAGAEDHYVPRRQLHRQASTLTHARSVTTRLLTAADQAQHHCHVGNVPLSVRVILTWIDSLGEATAAPAPAA